MKRKVITQNYTCGGLQIIDLDHYVKGLKSTWIRRILRVSHSNQRVLNESCIDVEILLKAGSDYQFHDQNKQLNNFWKDVLTHIMKFRTKQNSIFVSLYGITRISGLIINHFSTEHGITKV